MSQCMTKPTKWHVRPAKTQICFGIRPVWSESSLSVWRKLGPLATHWEHSKDSDQTGRMSRLICLRWAHMPFCRFCHALAQICLVDEGVISSSCKLQLIKLITVSFILPVSCFFGYVISGHTFIITPKCLNILDGKSSFSVSVLSGVPQDSVLSPVLFFIHINDLSKHVTNSTVNLFADDTLLCLTIHNSSGPSCSKHR